jgi:hypothetical protein
MPQRSAADIPWLVRTLGLFCLLAAAVTLTACDRCGNFLPSSQDQIGACRSDAPRPQ